MIKRHGLKSWVVNSFVSLFSIHRHSPLPVRRSSNPYKDSKPANNRLSAAVRAQQRHTPRGPNGDRSKPSKAKEKKESREGKEAAGKAKDDKVKNMLLVSVHHLLLHVMLHMFRLNYLPCWLNMLLVYLPPYLACCSSFVSGRNQPTWIASREQGRAIMFCVCLPEQRRCPGERSQKVWRDRIWQRPCGSSGERYYISESKC